jgi:hypothetical protein
MRKQELVYVHGLLAELREFYEQSNGHSISAPEYDVMTVKPTSIHRSKPEHEAAVFALASAMADEMSELPAPLRAD